MTVNGFLELSRATPFEQENFSTTSDIENGIFDKLKKYEYREFLQELGSLPDFQTQQERLFLFDLWAEKIVEVWGNLFSQLTVNKEDIFHVFEKYLEDFYDQESLFQDIENGIDTLQNLFQQINSTMLQLKTYAHMYQTCCMKFNRIAKIKLPLIKPQYPKEGLASRDQISKIAIEFENEVRQGIQTMKEVYFQKSASSNLRISKWLESLDDPDLGKALTNLMNRPFVF